MDGEMMNDMKKPMLGIAIEKEEVAPDMEETSGVMFSIPKGIQLPNVEEGARFNMEAQFEKMGDQIKLVSFGGKDLDGGSEEEDKEMSLEEEGNSLKAQLGKDESYE